MTTFVGRERELAAARALLLDSGVRLLTLTGPGGSGKTRLALRLAVEVANQFHRGVGFIPLSDVADAGLVLPAIARALGVREAPGQSPLDMLISYLRAGERLLLLDSFEHVLAAGSNVAALLAACPGLTVLVTSRTRLHLQGEHDLPVPPLPLPDPSMLQSATAAQLLQSPAVALFVQRAAAANPRLDFDERQIRAAAEICLRLDGLPLAIELAAARVRVVAPVALLARLGRRLPLLSDGPRDAPTRQRTLRDTIAWSYGLLAPSEQRFFQHLAVFVGGCTIAAAAVVDGAEGAEAAATLDRLASLIDHSLLRGEALGSDEPRYVLLETIREFALEMLDASGETAAVRARHTAHYLALAGAVAGTSWATTSGWLGRLQPEWGNILAALRWAAEHGEVERALRLSGNLDEFWSLGAQVTEARAWLSALLAMPGAQVPSTGRSLALRAAGNLAYQQGDEAAAQLAFTEAIAIERALGDLRGLARTLVWASLAMTGLGEPGAARTALEEALPLLRQYDDREYLARGLLFLGRAWYALGGEPSRVRTLLDEGLALARETEDARAIATALHWLGHVAVAGADYERARAYYQESLLMRQRIHYPGGVAFTLTGFANLAAAQGHHAHALRLFGAAIRQGAAMGMPARRLLAAPDIDARLAAARRALCEGAAEAALAQGRLMTSEEAIAFALLPPVSPPHPAGLTAREVEVLQLVATGLTDAEVAARLVLSRRTVEQHLRSVYTKLGVGSRTAAARFAYRHGLA